MVIVLITGERGGDRKAHWGHNMNIEYTGIGWKHRIRQRRASYCITIAKEVVLGNLLQEKAHLYYYLAKCENRNALLMFLDGKSCDAQPLSELSLKSMCNHGSSSVAP